MDRSTTVYAVVDESGRTWSIFGSQEAAFAYAVRSSNGQKLFQLHVEPWEVKGDAA